MALSGAQALLPETQAHRAAGKAAVVMMLQQVQGVRLRHCRVSVAAGRLGSQGPGARVAVHPADTAHARGGGTQVDTEIEIGRLVRPFEISKLRDLRG